MQDEAMDDIIREAATGHEAAFDERAWLDMRQKLDKYLPQKNRKRRYLFLILSILGLSGAFWLLWPTGGNKIPKTASPMAKTMASEQGATVTAPTVIQPGQPALLNNGFDLAQLPSVAILQPTKDIGDKTPGLDMLPQAGTAGEKINRLPATVPKQRNGRLRTYLQASEFSETNPSAVELGPSSTVSELSDIVILGNVESGLPNDAQHNMAPANIVQLQQPVASMPSTDTSKSKPANVVEQPKKSFGSYWVLLVSAGADMSYVRLSKVGKTTMRYGAGLGYSLGKRLLVRAGIYSVEKIYFGNKSDYTLQQPAASNPSLYQIDGRCRVYEVPVGLSYYFGRQKQHRWFVAAGLATLLMKTEQYDYQYKSATGLNYTRSYGVSNENNHFFSILALSGGYQYQINNRFALLAEPYFQLPLNGVGLGKVKLKSVGMTVTAAFSPFGKI